MSSAARDSDLARISSTDVNLRKIGSWRGIRVLAWNADDLYACRGYRLLRLKASDLTSGNADWRPVAQFRAEWWRNLTARSALTYRLFRDGFHALTILGEQAIDRQALIAAVPGAILACDGAGGDFRVTHKVIRGTRPLHITSVPRGNIYWGEYFDNRERAEVHIYASTDRGASWHVAHTFQAGAIRHVHNIVYDQYADCLWILTGDEGAECKVLRADRDLRHIEVVLTGNQQARAVAAIPTRDAIYLSTDTPTEKNHVLRVDRAGRINVAADLASSSIFGCRTANALFFSTMAEPSRVNTTREVHLVSSADGTRWRVVVQCQKDSWPMHYFQYGNVILPDGENTTNHLAATAIAVKRDDLVTTIWEVVTNDATAQPSSKSRGQDHRHSPIAENRAS